MKRESKAAWHVSLLAVVAVISVSPAIASSLIDATAVVENLFPGPGGDPVVQLEWGVRNLTADTGLSVILEAHVAYSNGLRQLVFPPQVVALGPAEARINLAFVIVPDQAGAGTATFRVAARVQRVDSGSGGSGKLVSDEDTFEVVP